MGGPGHPPRAPEPGPNVHSPTAGRRHRFLASRTGTRTGVAAFSRRPCPPGRPRTRGGAGAAPRPRPPSRRHLSLPPLVPSVSPSGSWLPARGLQKQLSFLVRRQGGWTALGLRVGLPTARHLKPTTAASLASEADFKGPEEGPPQPSRCADQRPPAPRPGCTLVLTRPPPLRIALEVSMFKTISQTSSDHCLVASGGRLGRFGHHVWVSRWESSLPCCLLASLLGDGHCVPLNRDISVVSAAAR